MTKNEAIQATKDGWDVSHPQTEGWMKLNIVYRPTASGLNESREVWFHGDCSPKNGWQAEWLGER